MLGHNPTICEELGENIAGISYMGPWHLSIRAFSIVQPSMVLISRQFVHNLSSNVGLWWLTWRGLAFPPFSRPFPSYRLQRTGG